MTNNTPAAIELVIEPRIHNLGAFDVRRSLPVREQRSVGPFVFFDHFGPAELPPEQPINVRPHPHIGLSTLTWLFDGAMMHRDSLGYQQEILPGEVNWMTAGSGIVHSERSPERLLHQAQSIHGLQTWLALPREHEETAPGFQHHTADKLPHISEHGMQATIIAGQAWGQQAPVAVFSDTLYVDVRLQKGVKLDLGTEHEERAIYAITGQVAVAGTEYPTGHILVIKQDQAAVIEAIADAHLVLIGGARLDGERHIWWNFVASSKQRIEEAKADWREGRFATIPSDEDEFIPLPDA